MHLIQQWELLVVGTEPVIVTDRQGMHILGTCIVGMNHGDVNAALSLESSDDMLLWSPLVIDGSAAGVMAAKSGFTGLFYAGNFKYVRAKLDVSVPEGVSITLLQPSRPSAVLS